MALTQEDVDHTLLLARQGFELQDSRRRAAPCSPRC
jgi:hypothetical protein